MDPESKQLLEENLKLSKENNLMLLKLIKIQRWAQITRYIYWGVLILISMGALYFVKPMINNLLNVYTGGAFGEQNISDVNKGLSSKDQLNQLIRELNQ